MKRKRKKLKAVYTVEAAIIIPMVLFTMASGIKIGLDLYQKASQYAADIKDVADYKEIDTVHKLRTAGAILKGVQSGN